jgi:hypothetical protein
LLASDDERVALRAAIEVFDRTLGRPKQQREPGHSFEQWPDMDAALTEAHEKLRRGSARHTDPTLTAG